MGIPVIEVSFEQLAASAVKRSTRGTVALILEDDTAALSPVLIKNEADIVSADWTAGSAKRIKLAMRSGAAKVLAVRAAKTDGEADYTKTLTAIGSMDWSWAAAPDADSAQTADIAAWIKSARGEGKQYKAVLGAANAPDSEGIVNLCTTGISSDFFGTAESYTPAQYSVRVAGVLAGMALDRSATGTVFSDILSADAPDDADEDIDAGKFIIVFNGEQYECARAVTSLTAAAGVPSLFKKIKHVEGADIIASDIRAIWLANYKGKRINSYANKQSLCGEILAYLGLLSGSVLDPGSEPVCAVDPEKQSDFLRAAGVDVSQMEEAQILRANTGEKVFLSIRLQLADAMEDVYMAVSLN